LPQLSEDEYLLYTHKINDPTWLFNLEKDLDFAEEGESITTADGNVRRRMLTNGN
jgi:hypothetical protein